MKYTSFENKPMLTVSGMGILPMNEIPTHGQDAHATRFTKIRLSLRVSISYLLALIIAASSLCADDSLIMKNGEKRSGRLSGIDEKFIRFQVPLPPAPGAPPNATPVFASISIPRTDIVHIEFETDPALEEKLKTATVKQLAEIEAIWAKNSPWLGVAQSPAARIGYALGELLLRTGNPARSSQALELFQRIESQAWNDEDKSLARQGRLRAMVATGHAKDAIEEATELAKISEEPTVLLAAKFILAEAADRALRKLVEDNPRWQEDVYVIPERNRLYHEALDLYLYPCLFFGSETESAARGLLGAMGVYQFTGETQNALECARDLVTIYPDTPYAEQAQAFIKSLPESMLAYNPEKEATINNAMPSESPHETKTLPAAEKPNANTSKKSPEKKSHEKKDKK